MFPEILSNEMISDTLADEKDFYKHVASAGPGIVAILRPEDMRLLFVNDAFEHYLGYSKAEVKAGTVVFTDLLYGYQLLKFEHQLKHINERFENRSHCVTYNLSNKNGDTAPYNLFLSPLEEEGKGLVYYLLLHPDSSKWALPYATYDTKEVFLQQFSDEDFGTFEWLVDVNKVYWSPGIYSIYEVDPSNHDISREFATSFLHPDDVQRIEDDALYNAKDGETDIEFRIITAKGNTKTIHSLARFVYNDDKTAVKFVGSIRDVSRQRAIENDLKNKVEELNHSNKELEEFAYVASHDMQEPLRKITTFGSRLQEKYKEVLTGDGAMYLARMTTAAENMRVLITDLLDFSRIAKNMQPFEQVYLSVILRLVKTELELVIEETGCEIKSAALPMIDGIPSQMKQLFANLITNAIKFHKEGVNPVITIDCEELCAEEKSGHKLPKDIFYYKIQVADNGIGFEDEYAVRIFNVFQRLHGKSEYPGSGIGLAICKKIIEHHNGIIYAENVPGIGAKFTFIVPREQQKNH